MPKTRTIRRAYVEYQPDLQTPRDPIPLGVIVEELGDGQLVVVGREPKGSLETLNLEHLWGPFRTALTDWMEVVDKNLDEAIAARPEGSVLDVIAQQWTKNIYLRQPENVEITSPSKPLMQYATEWYKRHVGEPFPTQAHAAAPRPRARRATRQPIPWKKRLNEVPLVACATG